MYHSNLINSPIAVSPHGSFKVRGLCQSVAICEAVKGDRLNWGNGTDTEPAFIVYLGCKKEEVASKIGYINNALGCYWCEVRQPKYLRNFEAEIKIRGMIRHSTEERNGLDFLVWSENDFNYIESDEYDYYVTGHQPRW